MKKLLFGAMVALTGALAVSCGNKEVKKELPGKKVETEQLSFIIPEGWQEIPTGADKYCVKKIRKGEGKRSDMKQLSIDIVEDKGPNPVTDPAERRDRQVKNMHFESLGDTILADKQYFIAQKAEAHKTIFYAKMKEGSDQILMLVAEYSTDKNDQELLDIIENITIK